MPTDRTDLYQYVNVGTGSPVSKRADLYQYENTVAGAPCPWVNGTDLPIATAGQPLTIYGQGFTFGGADTGPEARAHETNDPGSPYVVMGALTAWTDTEVVVSVPAGLNNPSFIRVVHTGPDATTLCTGSNLVYQEIAPFQPIESDPEAGWWVEAWNLTNTAPLIRGIPVMTGPWQKVLNDVGDGSITLPAPDPDDPDAFNRHREICDPPNNITTLLKVYVDGVYRYSFWADQISDPYGDPSEQVVTITGRGLESILEWGRLYPRDYDPLNPTLPTVYPDWDYGFSVEYFEGFEDTDIGEDPDWESRNNGALSTIVPGEYTVSPAGVHSGVQRTYEVADGARVKWEGEILGNVAGQRITLGIAFGGTGAGILSANTFVYNGEYLSELSNVASSGTGCPGGATSDTVWQPSIVDLQLPDGVTSITVFVQSDHHPSCGPPGNVPFLLRNAVLTQVGYPPPAGWESRDTDVFEVREGVGNGGGFGLVLEGESGSSC